MTSPHSNFSSLAKASQTNSKGRLFKSSAGYLKYLPNSYVVSLYCGNDSSFYPVEFLVISNLNGKLTVEQITGSGINNVYTLYGDDAKTYLDEHALDIKLVDDALKNRTN